VVHRVGNQARAKSATVRSHHHVDEAVSELFAHGYLKGIVPTKKKFQLFHETDLKLNEISTIHVSFSL